MQSGNYLLYILRCQHWAERTRPNVKIYFIDYLIQSANTVLEYEIDDMVMHKVQDVLMSLEIYHYSTAFVLQSIIIIQCWSSNIV